MLPRFFQYRLVFVGTLLAAAVVTAAPESWAGCPGRRAQPVVKPLPVVRFGRVVPQTFELDGQVYSIVCVDRGGTMTPGQVVPAEGGTSKFLALQDVLQAKTEYAQGLGWDCNCLKKEGQKLARRKPSSENAALRKKNKRQLKARQVKRDTAVAEMEWYKRFVEKGEQTCLGN